MTSLIISTSYKRNRFSYTNFKSITFNDNYISLK